MVELISCFETSNHMIWLINFVIGFLVVTNIKKLFSIYCDNNLVVLYSNNNRSSIRSKVIDMKYMIVKERIKKNKDICRAYTKRQYVSWPTNLWLTHEHICCSYCVFLLLPWSNGSLYVLCLDSDFMYLIFYINKYYSL